MAFDPNQFAQQPADPMATTFEVAPEGDFPFLIDTDPAQLVPEEISGISKKTGKEFHFYKLTLNCICQDEGVKQKLGRDRVVVRMQITLDFDENGNLDNSPNRNIKLGQLRAALNQNEPGWTPQQLLGAGPFIGKVTHSSSDNNPDQKFADITSATKLA